MIDFFKYKVKFIRMYWFRVVWIFFFILVGINNICVFGSC